MAVFTFSTRDTRPSDTQLVKEIKEHCDKEGKNFSSLVLNLLKEWKQANERTEAKV